MKKILLVSPAVRIGGAEKFLITLSKHLLFLNYQVVLCMEKQVETAVFMEEMEQLGVEVVDAKISEDKKPLKYSFLRKWNNKRKASDILRKVKPDIVLLDLPWPDRLLQFMQVSEKLKVKCVTVFQLASNVISVEEKHKKVYQDLVKKGNHFIAVSKENSRNITSTFGLDKKGVQVIYNGFTASAINKSSINNYKKEGQIAVLTVARLSKIKGHELIIDAAPTLIEQFPSVHFYWVGDGEDDERLRKEIESKGLSKHITLLGYQTNIPELLAEADLFLFPTRGEGFPFSILEAMAAELPVVSSDASSIPEVVQHEVNGLLFKSGDADDLKLKMIQALSDMDEMKVLAKEGLRAQAAFSDDRMLQAYEELFKDLT